jgi:hypothetical protein
VVLYPNIHGSLGVKILAEIDGFESDSDDSGDGLSRGNDDNSHAKVPNDPTYSEGDEWFIDKSSLRMTMHAFVFLWKIL